MLAASRGTAQAQERHENVKLTAADAADGDAFGLSVSISGDTMVVGAFFDDCGAGINCGSAYVYELTGTAWIQQAKLTASDAAAVDVFSSSVSISGDTIVVGAYGDDCLAGGNCGSAYVFVKPGGGWSDMTQTAKLTASDAADSDNFGYSVSIDGDTIVVGAYGDDCIAGADCGSAYVFVKPGLDWSNMTQTAKLTASDTAAGDAFGASVSISGNTIVAGAYGDAHPGLNMGSAYVFTKPGGEWSNMTQTAKLTVSDAAGSDNFGNSVSISGDTIVVLASGDDCGAGVNCGAGYVFVQPGGGWSNMTEDAKLTASDAAGDDQFGYQVSISEDTIVVGVAWDDCGAGLTCGSAYVFVKPGGGWSNMTETVKLTASDAAAVDAFGQSVSTSGDTIVVGAPNHDCGGGANCGAAYVFLPPCSAPNRCQQDAGAWTKFVWLSDSSNSTGPIAVADDFVAQEAGMLSTVCVIGTYLDPNPGPVNCTGSGYADDFTVSIYANGGDGPGVLIGSSAAVVSDSAIEFTQEPGSHPFTRHQLSLTTPIGTLQTGTTYWIKVQNNTVGGPPGCNWYWLDADPALGGNGVMYSDGDGDGFDMPADAWADDVSFCLNLDMGTPPCPFGVPSNDTCPPAVPLGAGITPYDTFCSSNSSTPPFSPSPPEDVWFSFIAPCSATASVTVATDGFESHCFKVYATGTSTCTCPVTEVGQLCSTSRTFPITGGQCYLLRVGGDSPNGLPAFGTLDVSFDCPAPATLYVNHAATGLNNGTSWSHAFTSLQSALTAANPGDEVWVAKGTYKPAGPGGSRSATFQLESGVALYGGFAGGESSRDLRDPDNNKTTLSGDLNGDDTRVACVADSPDCDSFGGFCIDNFCAISDNNDENAYHVVTGGGTDATAILDGFTITAGNADGVVPEDHGGGMYTLNGSPTVLNCNFNGNRANSSGGGMYSRDGSPTVSNCTFSGNFASLAAGIYNLATNAVISNCTFQNNRAQSGGGGMVNQSGNPTIINSAFLGNYGGNGGGGMVIQVGSNATLTNCVFSGNSTNGDGGGLEYNSTASSTLTNCTFTGNFALDQGGGIHTSNGNPQLTNCVFWNNADIGGMDESAQIHTISGTPTVTYSIVQGTWTGAGGNNSSSDPLFVDPGSGDVRLQGGSPAIDAGNSTALPLDTDDLDGDGSTAERISLDLIGSPRILGGVVDMGAYEFFEDCNGGGIPDVCDLDCGAPDGPCDIPGCGDSLDCNANAVLDACDIASGSSEDCNLNGILDACDIAGMTSLDVVPPPSGDGIPDECVTNTGTGGTPNWNDGTNWNLAGSFPDDTAGVADQHVTLEDSLILNVPVTIDSLLIVSGVTLEVTGGDLLITGAAAQTAGITPPPKLRLSLDGAVATSNGYDVTVPTDSVAVNSGGLYHSTGSTDSALSAVDITVYTGGELTLEHSMTMTSSGTLTLDGTGITLPVPCLPFAVAGDAPLGITPPPKLRLRNNVIGNAGGSIAMVGAVDVVVDSTQPVSVGGDFDNRSVVPHLFDWTAGKLLMNGSTPQIFEAAGINLGQSVEGFLTNADATSDTCQHTNFSMGTVEVASTANVTFANRFANTVAVGCAEALYVHNLTFQSGATVTIDNCKVYYDSLTPNGVTPTLIGCGELLSTARPQTPIPPPSSINKNRGLELSIPVPNTAGPGALTALRVGLLELQRPDPPNLPQNPPPDFSAFEFAPTCTDPAGCVRWIGEPKVFLESQDSPGSGNFMAARLQCTPLYRDWTTAGAFYVVGAEIIPSSTYRVEQFSLSCDGKESSCTAVSATLPITTARSGDVEAPFNPPLTSTQPNAIDIAQVVAKVKNLAGALPKALAQLQPNVPELNADVNALDIVAVVDAVKQKAYAFSGPCACPSAVPCGPAVGSVACTSPTPCVTAFGAGAMCVKACTGGDNDGDPCINNSHCLGGGTCGAGFCRDRCGRCTP